MIAMALCLFLVPSFLAAQGNGEGVAVHPLLVPILDQPVPQLTPALKGPAGGFQGRKTLQGEEALSLIVQTTASREQLESYGVVVRTMRQGRATVTVLPQDLKSLIDQGLLLSVALPQRVYPNLDTSVEETGVEPLRSESGGAFSGATGSGVIVGVVDSGIDFDHPNFTDSSGNTRILYLWDQQNDDASRYPSGYGYGTEWTASDIDAGTPTEEDDPGALGHGTHVTSIAAGSGAAPDASGATYERVGMAPAADIIFVKTSWMTDDIIDAMNYIFDLATAAGKASVINLSLGTQLGAHDGLNPMEMEIDALVTAQVGRAVVVAAGNEHGASIHAEIKAIEAASVIGPDFDIASYTPTPGAGNDYLYIVGYYPSTDDLTVHLWTPSGDYLFKTLYTGGGGGPCTPATATTDGMIQLCNNYRSQLGEGTSAREIIVLAVDNSATDPPGSGSWHMALSGVSVAGSGGDGGVGIYNPDAGEVDFWMVSSLGGSSTNAYFVSHVDEEETLGIPATSREAITVGAYVTRNCWTDYTGASRSYSTTYSLGDIAPFSGWGPTRDNRNKPDLAAPGMGIVSGMAQEVRSDLISAGYGAYVVDDYYMLMQGTSQAAPHVAGAVALFFEEDAGYSNSDIKSLLRTTAREDSQSDGYLTPSPFWLSLATYYNPVFGAGKLDLGSWAYNDPYESNERIDQSFRVLSGQQMQGYIERADDVDYFKVEGMAWGDTIEVDLTALPEDYALTLQSYFSLPGSCGATPFGQTRSSSDNSGTSDENVSYTSGVILANRVRVESSAGAYDTTTPYSLEAVLTRPETSSSHSTTGTAQVMPEMVEMKVAGSLASLSEDDYYKVVVKAGETLTAKVGFSGPRVNIYNGSGSLLASGFAGTASYTAPNLPMFTEYSYFVRVDNSTGSYTLRLSVN